MRHHTKHRLIVTAVVTFFMVWSMFALLGLFTFASWVWQ